MVPILLAAAEFEARTIIVGLIVAVIVALIVYAICLLLNHVRVPIPPAPVALVIGLLVFLLYALDAFD